MIKLCRQNHPICEDTVTISKSLIVFEDLTWTLNVHGRRLDPLQCSALSDIPTKLTFDAFKDLVTIIRDFNICIGHPDPKFIQMAKARKGKFLSLKKQVVSYLDSNCCIIFNGEIHPSTIRHSKCEFLIEGSLCKVCSSYRSNLRAMYSNFMKRKNFKMSGNDRYMGAL